MTHDARPTTSRLGLALPETPLAEPGKQRPVVVKSPARRMPRKHWIDLTDDQRVQAVKDLGLPAFRAKQLSTHYFERLVEALGNTAELTGEERRSRDGIRGRQVTLR